MHDLLSKRGWHLNALQRPAALHICFTAAHSPGIVELLLSDLGEVVAQALKVRLHAPAGAPRFSCVQKAAALRTWKCMVRGCSNRPRAATARDWWQRRQHSTARAVLPACAYVCSARIPTIAGSRISACLQRRHPTSHLPIPGRPQPPTSTHTTHPPDRQDPSAGGDGNAPLYGMAATVPDRRIVSQFLTAFQDALLEAV